jgi:uncharacterized protein (TIGR02679 family)
MTAHELAQRMRLEGLGELLNQARHLLERSGQQLEYLRAAPSTIRGVIEWEVSSQERKAVADFLGHRFLSGKRADGPIRLRVAKLHEVLAGYGSDIFAVLEADGGALQTRADRHTRQSDEIARDLQRITAEFNATPAAEWLQMFEQESSSERWFRRAWQADRQAAVQAVTDVARAFGALPNEGSHIAMFAAQVAGNPHRFDQGTPGGQLLLLAVGEVFGDAPGKGDLPDPIWRSLQLGQAGLQVDGLSSDVAVANFVHSNHPVIHAMARHGGGWKVPLNQVRHLQLTPRPGEHAYVCENPSVFERLAALTLAWPVSERPLLICTSGFPSAAGYQLIEKLNASGYTLWYSGDFDPNGLLIARTLQVRFPALHLWRMSAEDYRHALWHAVSAPARLDEEGMTRLAKLEDALGDVVRALVTTGTPAYQEQLHDLLCRDLAHGRANG